MRNKLIEYFRGNFVDLSLRHHWWMMCGLSFGFIKFMRIFFPRYESFTGKFGGVKIGNRTRHQFRAEINVFVFGNISKSFRIVSVTNGILRNSMDFDSIMDEWRLHHLNFREFSPTQIEIQTNCTFFAKSFFCRIVFSHFEGCFQFSEGEFVNKCRMSSKSYALQAKIAFIGLSILIFFESFKYFE